MQNILYIVITAFRCKLCSRVYRGSGLRCVLESYVGLWLLLGISFFSQDVIAIGRMTYVPTRAVRSSRPVCVRVLPVNTAPTTVKPIHLARPDFFPAWKERY